MLQATLQQLQQQERFEKLFKRQAKDNKTFLEVVLSRATKEPGCRFFSAEEILNSLSEFKYDPDSDLTFPTYFHRYEAIFTKRYEQ